ncbi:MAG: bleomycin resistance protein [Hyphomonadaceae bacterium]|nr:bleomycin resistance protein [Hyphomonadaceae bacterium]
MADVITANLPSRNFDLTAAFYAALGFETDYRDPVWMILKRGTLVIEFFAYPDLDPFASSFSACIRVDDVDNLHRAWTRAGLPDTGIPRMTAPKTEPWGGRMFALVDPDGSLLRCIGFPA